LRRASRGREWRIGSAAAIWRSEFETSVWPLLVEVADVDAEDMLELASTEDQEPIEALSTDATDPALRVGVRVWSLDRRADDRNVFALWKMASKARLNFVSRSWIRNRNGCSSPSFMTRLRACWATQRPSGFELQATYSIRRVASEMKKRT
jgi:hypothetical protein